MSKRINTVSMVISAFLCALLGATGKLNGSFEISQTSMDRQIQAKRRMLAEIEKENVMTIAASLRSVPKKPEKKTNPLKEALGG